MVLELGREGGFRLWLGYGGGSKEGLNQPIVAATLAVRAGTVGEQQRSGMKWGHSL